MLKPLEVKPLPGFRLWLRYEDGAEGTVDLSGLVGKGVFAAWNAPGIFESVHLSPDGAIAWSDEIELCPDATYMRLTGKKPEEVFPNLRLVHA